MRENSSKLEAAFHNFQGQSRFVIMDKVEHEKHLRPLYIASDGTHPVVSDPDCCLWDIYIRDPSGSSQTRIRISLDLKNPP